MRTTSSPYTVANFCQMLTNSTISVNRDYQRTDKVWPTSARSLLIETILLGYPMPKILLRQQTDLTTRKTTYEIVDGQQRARAILDFFNGDLRISRGEFAGKRWAGLDEGEQRAFLSYELTADVFAEATDEDIREVFRRINSYTIPLNAQETRHATFQGAFKWFVARMSHTYAESFKLMGVLQTRQFVRLGDGELLTEIVRAVLHGIETASPNNLRSMYKDFDEAFPEEDRIKAAIDGGMTWLLQQPDLHNLPIMAREIFLTVILAIMHAQHDVLPLKGIYTFAAAPGRRLARPELVVANFLELSEALRSADPEHPMTGFRKASGQGRNTKENRETRFTAFCDAIDRDLET